MLAGALAAIVLVVLTVVVLSGHGTSSSNTAAGLDYLEQQPRVRANRADHPAVPRRR